MLKGQEDFIYYAFVTMTTLGYGDITPVGSMARSLSIFFSVTGQLYLTMIIAILVGKYLSQKIDTDTDEDQSQPSGCFLLKLPGYTTDHDKWFVF